MDQTNRYADLDELIVRCRAVGAREAFSEAVACYRVGAFRASIVATWSAVVFDYLSKLRELELTGNGEATKILASFERAREQNDTQQALQLERELLDDARKKFDLLSPLEQEDLERLRTDRHRSAHPSLVTIDEPYAPSAELARCHLRNAAIHLLSRPPLQGQEAWTRIWTDVNSEFFPEDVNGAERVLGSRLSRARESLIRRLLTELVKTLLSHSESVERRRHIAALKATVSLFHQVATKYFAEKLPPLVDTVEDGRLSNLLDLCSRISLCWEHLPAVARDKLSAFCRKTEDPADLHTAMAISELRAIVNARDLTGGVLAAVARFKRDADLNEKVVLLLEKGSSYGDFRDVRAFLRDQDAMAGLTGEQLARMVLALAANPELRGYGGFSGVISELLAASRGRMAESEVAWTTVYPRLDVFHKPTVSSLFPKLGDGANAPGSAVHEGVAADEAAPRS